VSGYRIELRHVNKYFGDTQVLRDINIEIEPGEFVALVGKSGCGKSTLLRLISVLDRQSGGEIRIQDRLVDKIDANVRFLFQDARLLPWKNVWQNVILGSPERSRDKAYQALAAVGLSGREEAWPSDLSGGQRQRVALARALVGTPEGLLLDEPLSALDALTRLNMQQLIEKLWKQLGLTIILVTHDVSEAVNLADRVILLDDGQITLDKSIELARPRVRSIDTAHYEHLILSHIMGDEAGKNLAEEYVI
jgi:sulfonate transport system ATP-binding protein